MITKSGACDHAERLSRVLIRYQLRKIDFGPSASIAALREKSSRRYLTEYSQGCLICKRLIHLNTLQFSVASAGLIDSSNGLSLTTGRIRSCVGGVSGHPCPHPRQDLPYGATALGLSEATL